MPRMRIQSEVLLAQDIERIIKALMLAADAIPAGEYKDGYAHGLRVVWHALCDMSSVQESRQSPPQLAGWEDVGIIDRSCFR